jgi:hypothetical protein
MKSKTTHTNAMTLLEIRREGFQALLDRLGPAGTIRFLQQYDPGRGDYTRDRHLWLDSLGDDETVAAVQQRQQRT